MEKKYKVGDQVTITRADHDHLNQNGVIVKPMSGPYNTWYEIKFEDGSIKLLPCTWFVPRKSAKQYKVDCLYLRMALIWSENSYAIRRQVGALVVKDHMIISDGYNGTPSGFENVCEDVVTDYGSYTRLDTLEEALECKKQGYKLVTKPYVLHAEANALTKLAKSNNSSIGATLYVTDEPCMECSKLIIQAGIVRVVYIRDYHKHEGIELLKRAGIKIQQVTMEELKENKHEKIQDIPGTGV